MNIILLAAELISGILLTQQIMIKIYIVIILVYFPLFCEFCVKSLEQSSYMQPQLCGGYIKYITSLQTYTRSSCFWFNCPEITMAWTNENIHKYVKSIAVPVV